MPSRDRAHVVCAENGAVFRCLRCGAVYRPALPCPIWAYVALAHGFAKEHEDCAAPDAPQEEEDHDV